MPTWIRQVWGPLESAFLTSARVRLTVLRGPMWTWPWPFLHPRHPSLHGLRNPVHSALPRPAWQTHFSRPPFVKALLPPSAELAVPALLAPEPCPASVSCASSWLVVDQPHPSVPVPSMSRAHSGCSEGIWRLAQ